MRKKDARAEHLSIAGALNWLSVSTSPDVTTATSLRAAHLKNPSPGHMDGEHALKHLKGTADWGIQFRPS